ncbi:preprotein translocase subunit YajC [Chitinophaga parva]|uniref:Sec translocon accessory complex subunit YajC n=1 Tax=Chitinophaga parva TaxID=2169414 RepID=A0A2T7BBF6_9BACT|nr:preprotein translocase subunit YajC [Chitinophaga parva]PUZ21707.1 preprotein translocase subunit YajC [Chitinophaga parva]
MNILLQAGGLGSMQPILLIGGMFLVMYFFMIRPQQKKAKDQKNFIDNLKEGDKLVTIAGIHGKLKKINDNGTLQIEVSPASYLTIERSAVSMEYTVAMNKPAEEKK